MDGTTCRYKDSSLQMKEKNKIFLKGRKVNSCTIVLLKVQALKDPFNSALIRLT